MDGVKIRELTREEIQLLHNIDRRETIERVYYERGGELVLEDEHWDVPEWSPESKANRVTKLEAIFDAGATFFGALVGERLAGMSVLEHGYLKTGERRLNLAGLWVSQAHRGKGVGRALFERAAAEAKRRAAKWMYVSATPSEHTVHFYMGLGCRRADPVDPDLFEAEPEDIHLELPLWVERPDRI